MVSIWKLYIKRLAQCLRDSDARGSPDAQSFAEAQCLASEACQLQMQIALCNPGLMKEFAACRMEDNEACEADSNQISLEVRDVARPGTLNLSRAPAWAILEKSTWMCGAINTTMVYGRMGCLIATEMPQACTDVHERMLCRKPYGVPPVVCAPAEGLPEKWLP